VATKETHIEHRFMGITLTNGYLKYEGSRGRRMERGSEYGSSERGITQFERKNKCLRNRENEGERGKRIENNESKGLSETVN